MKHLRRARLSGAVVLALALWSRGAAAEIEKGGHAWTLQITEASSDFGLYNAGASGYINFIRRSEIGFAAEYWRQWSDHHAYTVAAGVGITRETLLPGIDALLGERSQRGLYQSWQARLGVERLARIHERFHLYAGPGLHFWAGNVELAHGSTVTYKSRNTYRFGVDGRLGVKLSWSSRWGMMGQVGHYWGYLHATENSAKSKAIAGGATGAMGIYYTH